MVKLAAISQWNAAEFKGDSVKINFQIKTNLELYDMTIAEVEAYT